MALPDIHPNLVDLLLGPISDLPKRNQDVAGAWWIRTTIADFQKEVKRVLRCVAVPGVYGARLGQTTGVLDVQTGQIVAPSAADPNLVIRFSVPDEIGVNLYAVQFDDVWMSLRIPPPLDYAAPLVTAIIEQCQRIWEVIPQAEQIIPPDQEPIVAPAPRENLRRLHSPIARRAIVAHFNQAMQVGEVVDREAWAQSNYSICRKTLKKYCEEFPDG